MQILPRSDFASHSPTHPQPSDLLSISTDYLCLEPDESFTPCCPIPLICQKLLVHALLDASLALRFQNLETQDVGVALTLLGEFALVQGCDISTDLGVGSEGGGKTYR